VIAVGTGIAVGVVIVGAEDIIGTEIKPFGTRVSATR